jgi:hypothetical protein
MSSDSPPLAHLSSSPADLHVKRLVREALGELADSPLDGEDYNRVVEAFVRRGLI